MKFFERMILPLSKRDPMDEVVGAAKFCLNTVEGEIFLKHLVDEFKLDIPIGCDLTEGQTHYVNGTQDVVKYILSLINDKETR